MTPELEHIEIIKGNEVTSSPSLEAQEFGGAVSQMFDSYTKSLTTEITHLKETIHEKDLQIQEKDKLIQRQNETIELLKMLLESQGTTAPIKTLPKSQAFNEPQRTNFDSIIQTNVNFVEFKSELHRKLNGQKGKAVAAVLRKAYAEKLITKLPTEVEYCSEFILNGKWKSVSQYFPDNKLGDNTQIHAAMDNIIFSTKTM